MHHRTLLFPVCLFLLLILVVSINPTGAAAQSPKAVFSIVGDRILKNGSEFVIHGVNVNGPNWKWDRKTVPDLDMIVSQWKFNLVRVNCSLVPRPVKKESKEAKEPNDLDEIVRAFTARNVVVLIDPHDHPGGYYEDPAVPGGSPSLTELENWLKQAAARYKNNPYVWFEVMDAPGSREAKTVDLFWQGRHERILKTIRQEVGANNILVCEGHGEGGEDGHNGPLPVPESCSAILTYGPDLSRRYANVLYAFHIDGNWSGGGTEKLNDYLDRVQAKKLPIFVSEYGASGWPDSTSATEAMLAVCKPRHIGRCVWHWWAGDTRLCAPDDKPGGWQIDTTDGSKPSNLSWLGDKVWDDNHGLSPVHGPALDRTTWTATAFASSKDDGGHYNQPGEAFSPYSVAEDYWSSQTAQEPGQWFLVDMGARRTFSRLQIDTRARFSDYMRGYEIYVSNDGTNWGAPIARGKNEQSVLRLSFPVQTARYIKIVQTGKIWHHWVIADFTVYAPVGASSPLSVTQGPGSKSPIKEVRLDTHLWQAMAEPKIWNANLPLQPVVNEGEYAGTGQSQQPNQYYQVDMREPQRLHKIVLVCARNPSDYPRGYEVYVSDNGTEWGKPVAAGRGAPITTITFPSQTARYFRIVLTRYGRNYWAIAAVRVYGGESGGGAPVPLENTKK